jgi:hypothetical protein
LRNLGSIFGTDITRRFAPPKVPASVLANLPCSRHLSDNLLQQTLNLI